MNNMPMNSMQSEFDAVVAHLYKQGRPAKHEVIGKHGSSCKYRLQDGDVILKCAVGCRIPDEAYDPRMDTMQDTGVYDILEEFFYELPREISEYAPMFTALQRVHDTQDVGSFNFTVLEGDLRTVAKEFGLAFTKPEGY